MAKKEKKSSNTKLQIVDYSERSFAIVGDTKPVKDDMKRLGGRFNPLLTCGPGWIFSKRAYDSVQSYIETGRVPKSRK